MPLITPFELFLSLTALCLVSTLSLWRHRQHLLLANMVVNGCQLGIVYLNDLPLNVAIYALVITGALVQMALGSRETRQLLLLRNGIALVCIGLATVFLYERPIDLLAVAALSCARIGEAQVNPRHTKLGYFYCVMLLVSFSALSGIYSSLVPHICGFIGLGMGLYGASARQAMQRFISGKPAVVATP